MKGADVFHRYPTTLAVVICAALLMWSAACKKTESPEAGQAAGDADLPILGTWDFEGGDAGGWTPNFPANWRVVEDGGSMAFALVAPGEQGEIRAPTSIAVLPAFDLASFEFTGRMKCAADPAVPQRDLCVFFNYQDPRHFGYVHFSASSDANHNIIGLVDGADRVKVNREPEGGSVARLTDLEWHAFKITFDAASGEAAAYIDDMETPVLTARDTVLGHGSVGVGSFDDTGAFDDLVLKGRLFGEGTR
jgi:hypothetical protein